MKTEIMNKRLVGIKEIINQSYRSVNAKSIHNDVVNELNVTKTRGNIMKFVIILSTLLSSSLSFADGLTYSNDIGEGGEEIVYANSADEASCVAMDDLIDATKKLIAYRKQEAYSHVVNLELKSELSSMWVLRAKEFAERGNDKGFSKLFEDHMSQACQTFYPSDVDLTVKEMQRYKKAIKGI